MKSPKKMIFLAILSSLFIISGCSSMNRSGPVYSQGQSQRALSVYYGTIIELREVTIAKANTGAGAVLGGIAGGVAGSTIGSGSGRTLAALGGALAGAVAGSAIESGSGTKAGMELTIELDNGRLMAVVQEQDGYYRVGDRVRLLQSSDGTWRVRQ